MQENNFKYQQYKNRKTESLLNNWLFEIPHWLPIHMPKGRDCLDLYW